MDTIRQAPRGTTATGPRELHAAAAPVVIVDVSDRALAGEATTPLVVVAAPGARAEWFLDALTEDGRVRRAGHRGGVTAVDASRPGVAHVFDRRRPERLLVLRRDDLRACAVAEHCDELATRRRLPSPCTLTAHDLDGDRIATLHRRLHGALDDLDRMARDRGVPTMVLSLEAWAATPTPALERVRRWLDVDVPLGRNPGAPVPCHDCVALEAGVVARVARRIPCRACDEPAP